MKFTILKEHLERALVTAERFAGKNVTLPILGNVLIEADEASLKITGTNLEYAVQITIPGRGGKGGKISVPAKIISALVQTIKEEKITLEEKQGHLLVHTEQRDIKINGMPAEDFPLVPKVKKTAFFSVDSFSLKENIEKTIPAVSFSEFKPELSGLFFLIHANNSILAATDTFRLAESAVEISGSGEGLPVSFILPQRIAQELTRIWGKEESTVRVTIGENQAMFENGEVKIISRLIEGSFPDYGGVIPKSHDASCEISRYELIDAVKSSSIFSSKLQEVKLRFEEKTLTVMAANTEVGEYKTTLPITPVKSSVELGFNYRYLLDGLGVLAGDKCFLGLGNGSSPTLLRSTTDPAFIYILMPIQMN